MAIDPFLVRGRDQATGFANRQHEDPLKDYFTCIASISLTKC